MAVRKTVKQRIKGKASREARRVVPAKPPVQNKCDNSESDASSISSSAVRYFSTSKKSKVKSSDSKSSALASGSESSSSQGLGLGLERRRTSPTGVKSDESDESIDIDAEFGLYSPKVAPTSHMIASSDSDLEINHNGVNPNESDGSMDIDAEIASESPKHGPTANKAHMIASSDSDLEILEIKERNTQVSAVMQLKFDVINAEFHDAGVNAESDGQDGAAADSCKSDLILRKGRLVEDDSSSVCSERVAKFKTPLPRRAFSIDCTPDTVEQASFLHGETYSTPTAPEPRATPLMDRIKSRQQPRNAPRVRGTPVLEPKARHSKPAVPKKKRPRVIKPIPELFEIEADVSSGADVSSDERDGEGDDTEMGFVVSQDATAENDLSFYHHAGLAPELGN
jgi:hypothetical protein